MTILAHSEPAGHCSAAAHKTGGPRPRVIFSAHNTGHRATKVLSDSHVRGYSQLFGLFKSAWLRSLAAVPALFIIAFLISFSSLAYWGELVATLFNIRSR